MARELGQLSLSGGRTGNRQLERIAALVEWVSFARRLGAVYLAVRPGLEEALSDRLSFRR